MSDKPAKPEKPKGDGVVRGMKSPVRMEYKVTAGKDLTRFLVSIVDGKIVGQRCEVCQKVYVPPRAGCPTCGVVMKDLVEVADKGTVTTFCIVNVPFEGQTMKLPYVYALIVLDGADNAFQHLITGIPADEVRMGLRVKAEWKPPADRRPTMESINWFVPTGEPDAPFDSYKEHL